MKIWVLEYQVREGWRPMNGNWPTKCEATFRLKERQKLEPVGDFRIMKYVRAEAEES